MPAYRERKGNARVRMSFSVRSEEELSERFRAALSLQRENPDIDFDIRISYVPDGAEGGG